MNTIKLQKYVSDCGLMSRRAAETHIADGEFTINGTTAQIGDRVEPGKDEVCFKGKPIKQITRKTTIALYKPVGYVTTMDDEFGRKNVSELTAAAGTRLYPAGRLDKDSEGLLICTNDGETANRLMHPSHHFRKVYLVTIKGKIENQQVDTLRSMRTLDGEELAPVSVDIIDRSPDESHIRMVLTQGKNRQIRRMCLHVGIVITSLKRISIGPVNLGDLQPGEWRALTPNELSLLNK